MSEEFQLKKLEKSDVLLFQKLIALFREVFEMEAYQDKEIIRLTNLLENSDFVVFCILSKNEVIGGITAYLLPSYYVTGTELFIYDLAIKKEYQRMGLGKKLLDFLKAFCKENSIGVLFVQANEEDREAIRFYQNTGGQAEKVIHFTYILDQLHEIG
jgi:aminoglycoside 3-N-acetyltransferase I